jgi:hypothetical protein
LLDPVDRWQFKMRNLRRKIKGSSWNIDAGRRKSKGKIWGSLMSWIGWLSIATLQLMSWGEERF